MSQKNDSWGFSHTKYFLAPLILSMLPHENSLSAPTQHGFNGLSNFEEFPAPRKKLIDRYSCFSSSGNWKNYSILLVYTLFSHITCSIHVGPTCRPHMSCEGRGYIPGVLNNYPGNWVHVWGHKLGEVEPMADTESIPSRDPNMY